jgi:hypothetical protein
MRCSSDWIASLALAPFTPISCEQRTITVTTRMAIRNLEALGIALPN